MSKMYTQASTPSHNFHDPECGLYDCQTDTPMPESDATYSTSREVIQQFTVGSSKLEAMFTVETTVDDDMILLKSFDNNGFMIQTAISYDTAYKLQTAISDAMDDLEATMGVNL